jgi:tripartite-type tricarboxylate transporter receptor subunit TctC
MKKFIILIGFLIAQTVHAQTIVPVVWPFSIGSNQVNFIRLITDEANQLQKKYKFIVEFKPGAGGYIAARYVQDYNGLAILSSSSSFYSRPVFYPNESHRVENFKPVYIECTDQPYLIVSSKFKTLNELKTQKRLTIGANHGSITESMVKELARTLPGVEVDLIPFTGTLAGTQEVIAGRIDLNVDLPGESLKFIETEKIFVIGSSGTKDYNLIRSFNSQGHKNFASLTGSYTMYVRSDTDDLITKEIHELFSKSARLAGKRLQDAYARDLCIGQDLNFKQTNELFNRWIQYWPTVLR